jgi:ADP-ribose pyrophosphatase YjhB (NUDIX family)
MNFCSQCGAQVALRVPESDTMPRHVCISCGVIHYSNPKVVVGCIPQWKDQLLLCRRAIEPRLGLWTLPAGFLENNETTMEGAMRETQEEARARVEVQQLYAVFSLPHINQVYVMFRANLLVPGFGPGAESSEVRLYRESEIPWNDIAFPVIEQTLKLFYADLKRGRFDTHTGDIVRLPGDQRVYKTKMLIAP